MQYEENRCPQATANIFSQLTFWWMNGFLQRGYKKHITEDDLFDLKKEHTANVNYLKFKKAWDNEIKKRGDKASLLRAFHHSYGWSLYLIGLWKLPHDLILLAGPLLLNRIVNYVTEVQQHEFDSTVVVTPTYYGYIYAILLLVLPVIQSIALQAYFMQVMTLAMNFRSACITTVYKKTLTLSSRARQDVRTGEVVNLMSVDADRIAEVLTYIHHLWSSPLQIIIALGLLYVQVGWVVVAGFVIMIVMIPLSSFIAKRSSRVSEAIMNIKDERVKQMNELLQGIRVIKFYAWETPFRQNVEKCRKQEYSKLRLMALFEAATYFVSDTAPVLVNIFVIALYAALGNELTAAGVFTTLSLINLLRSPIWILPWLISSLVNARVSISRINKYLLQEDIKDLPHLRSTTGANRPSSLRDNNLTVLGGGDVHEEEDDLSLLDASTSNKKSKKSRKSKTVVAEYPELAFSNEDDDQDGPLDEGIAIQFWHADFSWKGRQQQQQQQQQTGSSGKAPSAATTSDEANADESRPPTLQDITLAIKQGSLTSIVGPVGSGKSSLLSSIFGEIERTAGTLRVASASLAYCAQQPWIINSTLRDNITFGHPYDEQKYNEVVRVCDLLSDFKLLPQGDMTEIGEQGINLSGGQKARVSLARACYADADIYLLDSPLSAVDAHVGKHIFEECILSYLANKTRILVTHSLHFLDRSDYIVVMKDGKIIEQGTYTELLEHGCDFKQLIETHVAPAQEKKQDGSSDEANPEEDKEQHHEDDAVAVAVQLEQARSEEQRKQEAQNTKKGELIKEEEHEIGSVGFHVYKRYLAGYGTAVLLFIATCGLAGQALRIIMDWWMGEWSEDTLHRPIKFYLSIYIGFAIGGSVFICAMIYAFAMGSLRSSNDLHHKMLNCVLRAPVSFFDQTPVGRLLNRFSKDLSTVDQELPETGNSFLSCLLRVCSILLVICIATPLFLLFVVPIALLYFFIQQYYRRTSRELKRLDSITKSPLFSHFAATLNGVATIRAYGLQDQFAKQNEDKLNHNLKAYFINFAANRWLALRLEFTGCLVMFGAALFAVVGRTKADPAWVGMSIGYALTITSFLNWFVRMMVQSESQLTSVERILQYTNIESEAPAIIEGHRPPAGWPHAGEIIMKNVTMRYRKDLDPVLKNISCRISPCEKIGIVGRTGSGKSSLMLTLFRIVELFEGSIEIDGIDISTIGLEDLRSRLAIIPQDPQIFSGTIRSNLDPFQQFTDEDLWRALSRVHMYDAISKMPMKLEEPVVENGANLSVGQRQLLCMARALLRRSKIIVLDEATANVDVDSDAIIQRTIREEFANCTVLTIAHRLNTIMDYDRVMVLNAGELVDMDTVANLQAKGNPFFAAGSTSSMN